MQEWENWIWLRPLADVCVNVTVHVSAAINDSSDNYWQNTKANKKIIEGATQQLLSDVQDMEQQLQSPLEFEDVISVGDKRKTMVQIH